MRLDLPSLGLSLALRHHDIFHDFSNLCFSSSTPNMQILLLIACVKQSLCFVAKDIACNQNDDIVCCFKTPSATPVHMTTN